VFFHDFLLVSTPLYVPVGEQVDETTTTYHKDTAGCATT
jgi:hypothetical protein